MYLLILFIHAYIALIKQEKRGPMYSTGENVITKLMQSYQRFYNITRFDGKESPLPDNKDAIREAKKISLFPETEEIRLSAVCEYYEQTGQHLFMKSNEIWSANQEEFIFLFKVRHLDEYIFELGRNYAREEGMKMAHIGSGHMYTYISPVFICDSVSEEARRKLETCRIYKSFKFYFHGWMEFHAACLNMSSGDFYFNRAGRCMEKNLKNVLKEFIEKGA